MSDVISIKNPENNKREMHQKRYLIMSIREIHMLYNLECQDELKIGKTKVFDLRLQNVMVVSDTPHNVCVCQQHANFTYLCTSLKVIPGFPQSYKDFLKEVCCDINNENCMLGLCNKCVSDVNDILPLLFEIETYVQWKQWRKNKETGRIQLTKDRGMATEVIECLQNMLPGFKKHFFIKNVQSSHFEKSKQSVLKGEIILQIDFSENFAVQEQDEVQAAHFTYSQVTVFTACAWTAENSWSIVIVSDDLSHDKFCVWTFIQTII